MRAAATPWTLSAGGGARAGVNEILTVGPLSATYIIAIHYIHFAVLISCYVCIDRPMNNFDIAGVPTGSWTNSLLSCNF